MYRVLFFWLLATSTAAGSIIDGPVWINELHYDNVGADQNEFVEVVAPASWSVLSDVTLTLYNGGNGTAYGGPTPLSDFEVGASVDGFVFYSLAVSLQNGAPDGLALAHGNQVLQFLSYEGTFTAADGVAQGLLSTDMGVSENTDAPLGSSLQLAGTGDSYLDFVWQSSAPDTLGNLNQGQSFAVPEPASVAIWLSAAGSLAVGWRGWQRRRRGRRSR